MKPEFIVQPGENLYKLPAGSKAASVRRNATMTRQILIDHIISILSKTNDN
jgi:hypothetical protein